MTYEATVEFKFDATYTYNHNCSTGYDADDFIPEERYLITAPAADLNCKQYFKLFEKFMLCVGMTPKSIRSGAMSLVFNDMVLEEEQRKVCDEYDLTMNEDLHGKYQEWNKLDAPFEQKGLGRFQAFAKYTDNDLKKMRTMYDTLYSEDIDSASGVA